MIETFLLFNTIILLLVLLMIPYQEKQHRLEREQLYNRIMAKDFPEYASMTREPSKGKRSHNFIKDGLLSQQPKNTGAE